MKKPAAKRESLSIGRSALRFIVLKKSDRGNSGVLAHPTIQVLDEFYDDSRRMLLVDKIPTLSAFSSGKIMRKLAFLGLMTLSAVATAEPTVASASYQISVQNESGVETESRIFPSNGRVQTLPMVGATVEIITPSTESALTELRLYSDKPDHKLLHTARISGSALPVRVAYSICNGRVTYMSPAPVLSGPCTTNQAHN